MAIHGAMATGIGHYGALASLIHWGIGSSLRQLLRQWASGFRDFSCPGRSSGSEKQIIILLPHIHTHNKPSFPSHPKLSPEQPTQPTNFKQTFSSSLAASLLHAGCHGCHGCSAARPVLFRIWSSVCHQPGAPSLANQPTALSGHECLTLRLRTVKATGRAGAQKGLSSVAAPVTIP